MFENCHNLKHVIFSNNFLLGNIIDLSYMFNNCNSLEYIDYFPIINKYTENISYIFSNCSSLKYIEFSSSDAYNIKDMSGSFQGCSSLSTVNLSSFKTQNLINIQSMFDGCTSITSINISFLNLNKVTNFDYMLRNCSKLTFIELPDLIFEKLGKQNNIFIGCNSLSPQFLKKFRKNIEEKYDICIVGLWYGSNYGSMITYYALHKAISKLGYSILMVNNPFSSLSKTIYSRIHPKYITKSFYNISEVKKLDKLNELNELCHCFLVGSDQLWNINLSRNLKQFYFLGFVNDEKKKISYGTSFGDIYKGTDEEKNITKINLQRFFAISVRDELSLNILRESFEIKNAAQVCDPSFLCSFSDYNELINKANLSYSDEYILAYVLDPNEEIGYRLEKLSIDKNITIIVLLNHLPDIWEENRKKLNLKGVGKVELKSILNS